MTDSNDATPAPDALANLSNKEKTFRTDVGIKATVQHREMSESDEMQSLNRKLIQLGIDATPIVGLQYQGSAAVHIYKSEVLGQLFFISQTQPLVVQRCPEMLASAAFNHLLATLKKTFGHNRPKLRSGF